MHRTPYRHKDHQHEWQPATSKRAGVVAHYQLCAVCATIKISLPDVPVSTGSEDAQPQFDWLTRQ